VLKKQLLARKWQHIVQKSSTFRDYSYLPVTVTRCVFITGRLLLCGCSHAMRTRRSLSLTGKERSWDGTQIHAATRISDPKHIPEIANTAGFHFAMIEQAEKRLYPACSVIRPTETEGAAMGAVTFLTDAGLFRGQSSAFFAFMTQLAQAADAA
jgi:hypothetical protein